MKNCKSKLQRKTTVWLILLLVSMSFTYGQKINKEKLALVVETGHSDWVETLKFSPNGKFLASSSYSRFDSIIKIWSAETGQELASFNDAAMTMAFSPDSNWLAVGGNTGGEIKLWNLKAGQKLKSLGENLPKQINDATNAVWALTFSPDGKVVAGVTSDKIIRLWDFRSGRLLKAFARSSSEISSMAFSNDAKNLITTGFDNIARVWSVETGQMLKPLDVCNAGERTIISQNGKRLASISAENIRVCDVGTKQELKTIPLGEDFVGESVIFSHDGKMIAASGAEEVNIWSAETGKKLKPLKGQINVPVSLAFSPDDNTLACGSDNTIISIWNTKTAAEIKVLEGRARPIFAAAFSADGKILAVGEYNQIRLWSLETGRPIKRFPVGHRHEDIWLSFSPDGKTIATSHHERQMINLFNVETGVFENSIDEYNIPDWLKRNDGQAVTSINGKTIQAQVDAGQIRLSDVSQKREITRLIGLDEDTWVVIKPDGRFDTNKPLDRVEGLHWVLNGEILKPLSLDIFMRQYFEPELLQRLLNCNSTDSCEQEFKPLPSIADINRVQPLIGKPKISAPKADGTVDVTVEAENMTEELTRNNKKERLSSGVYDLRLFRDGQLIGNSTPKDLLNKYIEAAPRLVEQVATSNTLVNTPEDKAWREANDLSKLVDFNAKGKATYTFKNIKLPQDGRREVEFSAYAFNTDRVKSETKREIYQIENPKTRKGKTYLVSIGVNASENAQYRLIYSAAVAKNYLEVLSPRLAAGNQKVIGVLLISDYDANTNQTTENNATKQIIKAVFDLLHGKRAEISAEILKRIPNADQIEPLQPEDNLIIAYSGHGYRSLNGFFYLLPNDIGTEVIDSDNPQILRKLISSDEISLWLRDLTAKEMVMIIDACNSEASVGSNEFKAGPMGSRGLGQLAFDKGMKILTATQTFNSAWQTCSLKQSLLSYALLEEGIKSKKADTIEPKSKLALNEWFGYAEIRVPELHLEVRQGKYDANCATEATLQRLGLVGSGNQKPRLFDFTKHRSDGFFINLP